MPLGTSICGVYGSRDPSVAGLQEEQGLRSESVIQRHSLSSLNINVLVLQSCVLRQARYWSMRRRSLSCALDQEHLVGRASRRAYLNRTWKVGLCGLFFSCSQTEKRCIWDVCSMKPSRTWSCENIFLYTAEQTLTGSSPCKPVWRRHVKAARLCLTPHWKLPEDSSRQGRQVPAWQQLHTSDSGAAWKSCHTDALLISASDAMPAEGIDQLM